MDETIDTIKRLTAGVDATALPEADLRLLERKSARKAPGSNPDLLERSENSKHLYLSPTSCLFPMTIPKPELQGTPRLATGAESPGAIPPLRGSITCLVPNDQTRVLTVHTPLDPRTGRATPPDAGGTRKRFSPSEILFSSSRRGYK